VRESGKFLLVECEIMSFGSWTLACEQAFGDFFPQTESLFTGYMDSRIQLEESGKALTTRIRNPSSTDKESAGIQCQVSGIRGMETSIQDCLGFPYVWQKLVFIVYITFFNRHFSSLITPYTEPLRCHHTRHQLHKK